MDVKDTAEGLEETLPSLHLRETFMLEEIRCGEDRRIYISPKRVVIKKGRRRKGRKKT